MTIRYTHTNIIAKDWKVLAIFYQEVFDCQPVLPERDLSGDWLDKVTNIKNVKIRGVHLQLPGYDKNGPTLEIFQYSETSEQLNINVNTPGFSHIAFHVDDVAKKSKEILKRGGKPVGEIMVKTYEEIGVLTIQYFTDPEGNIIELQNWS